MRISRSVDLRHVTKHFSGFHAFFPFYLCHLDIIFPNPIFLWDQWTQVATLVSRAFAFVFSWYKLIIDLSLYFSSWGLQHTVHISIIAAKIVSPEIFFSSSNISVRTWGSLEQKSYTNPVSTKCRLQTGYKMQTRYKMQTADWVQNADWEFILFFRLIRDIMSSCNFPSVTQSLFRDYLSRLFALLWNIPSPFLDHNRS